MKTRPALLIPLITGAALLTAVGASALSGVPILTLKENLSSNADSANVTGGWDAVSLKDTQGGLIAHFNYFFYENGPDPGHFRNPNLIPFKIQVWHLGSTHLDSLKMEFAPNGLSAPADLWLETPGGYPFNPVHIYKDYPKAVIDIPDMGFQGIGSVNLDLMIQIYRNAPVTSSYPFDLTVTLSFHDTSPIIVGRSYSGEFTLPMTIDPTGNVTIRPLY